MPRVVIASALARWLSDAGAALSSEIALAADGDTVAAVLAEVFAQHPALRGYVLDEHGALRHHVAVFVDGDAVRDKARLQQPVTARSELYIMQALSGG